LLLKLGLLKSVECIVNDVGGRSRAWGLASSSSLHQTLAASRVVEVGVHLVLDLASLLDEVSADSLSHAIS